MALGFGTLRLAPTAFWAMTPREFAAALRALAPVASERIGGAELAALMRRFPDGGVG